MSTESSNVFVLWSGHDQQYEATVLHGSTPGPGQYSGRGRRPTHQVNAVSRSCLVRTVNMLILSQ